MIMTGPLAHAARILIHWPRAHVARLAELDDTSLQSFECGQGDLAPGELGRLRHALEQGGAVFLTEDSGGGFGVRLKFHGRDVRAINRLEGEGGAVGSDDI
jgi:hypothetical protein